MSHDHSVDLTPTLRELQPRSIAGWKALTKAGLIVSLAVAALLLFMLLVFVIL